MNRDGLRVRLLGPVDVVVGGAPHPISGRRRKSVLAVLALHAGEVVGVDRLIDLVWGDDPPATAVNTIRQHVSYLRTAPGARAAIVAHPPGYRLEVAADAIDVTQVTRLTDESRLSADHAGNAGRLKAALRLWRGPSLADVAPVGWLRDQARRLDELRLETVERLVEARLGLGEHAALVSELEDLAARHPYREHLHKHLMLALYRCGRQADALGAYRRLRRTLAGELGVDPSPAVRDLEAAILRQDRDLSVPPPITPVATGRPAAPAPAVWAVPAQLPHALPVFSGRAGELAELDSRWPATTRVGDRQPATILLVSGTAGVGKTALAVHWAHQVKHRFPDGQLYVNLRGFDPSGAVMDPAEAVRWLLDALGVPADRIPAAPDNQASLYRSVLANRRVLVVIDNARDEEQVRPLLPGATGCLALVTSRDQLAGLVAIDGAHPLRLERPSTAEARRMLTARLGAQRVAEAAAAVDEIIAFCARLPLALAVAAGRAAVEPLLPLPRLAAQLGEATTVLDVLDGADPVANVRATFSWSYRTLSPAAARLFRLMAICPGPDIPLAAAAGVAAVPCTEARRLLAELTRTHLLIETSPDRFGFHELLRAYAIEQADLLDNDDERATARRRFLDHYLHTAHAGSRLLKPSLSPIELGAAAPDTVVTALADRDEALKWFTAEHPVLVAAMGRPDDGLDRHTWQLAWSLSTFLGMRGYLRENELVQQAGLDAARRSGDPLALGHAHRGLSRAHVAAGQLAEAEHHSRLALPLLAEAGDRVAMTGAHMVLSGIAGRRGNLAEALRQAESAHHIYRSVGHRPGQALAANSIGWYSGRLGEPERGLAYCREALDIFVAINDIEGAAATWDSLGALHFGLGDRQRGADCHHRAIALYRQLGDRLNEAEIHINLAEGHDRVGDHEAAEDAWRAARAILDDLAPDAADQLRSRLPAVPAS